MKSEMASSVTKNSKSFVFIMMTAGVLLYIKHFTTFHIAW